MARLELDSSGPRGHSLLAGQDPLSLPSLAFSLPPLPFLTHSVFLRSAHILSSHLVRQGQISKHMKQSQEAHGEAGGRNSGRGSRWGSHPGTKTAQSQALGPPGRLRVVSSQRGTLIT